jgi:hypothetical protein
VSTDSTREPLHFGVPAHLRSHVDRAARHIFFAGRPIPKIGIMVTQRCLDDELGSAFALPAATNTRDIVGYIRLSVKRGAGPMGWCTFNPGFLRYHTSEVATNPGLDSLERFIEPVHACAPKYELRETGMAWSEWVKEWLV